MDITDISTQAALKLAKAGSWYTISGAGGDLQEWVDGYNKLLKEKKIGTPTQWYKTTGAAVNRLAKPRDERDAFPEDITILMFPLDGLDCGKLAMFKLQMQDRWFDDIVANMR